MDVPERYEQLIAYLGSNLPAPVDRQEASDGSIRFIGGEPAEVVVLLTDAVHVFGEAAARRRAEMAAIAGELAAQRARGAHQRRA